MATYTMGESPGKMYALATVMTSLALLAVGLRFYARIIKKSGLSWDDLLIMLALVFTIATAICMFIATAVGDLGRHLEVHNGVAHFTHRIQVFEEMQFATMLTQVLTFGFTKLSVLFFYKRIFPGRLFGATVWAMIGLVSVWTTGFFFSGLLQCIPLSVNWSKAGNAIGQCINVNQMMIAQAWTDVATNFIILFLPIAGIFELQLPLSRKLGVCAIFLMGALTLASGVVKLVIYYQVFAALGTTSTDFIYLETPFIYWPMVESALGIIGACLPLMRPLIVGAASHGFMRKLRPFGTYSEGGSDTLWDSQMAKSTAGWDSTITTFQFGSASSASTKLGSISAPFGKPEGSFSSTRDQFQCVSPTHLDPADASHAIPKTRPIVRTHPLDNYGVLNDDFPFDRKPGRQGSGHAV